MFAPCRQFCYVIFHSREVSYGNRQRSKIHSAQPRAARAHHLRRSLRRRAADRTAVRHGRDVRSFRQQLLASKSPRSRTASSSTSTWTISTPAWRRSSPASRCGSPTSSATTPTRRCRSICASTRWPISSPVAVARQVPATAKLLEAREQLANLLRYMDGKVGAEDQLKKLLADPQLMAALKERALRQQPTKPILKQQIKAERLDMATRSKPQRAPQRKFRPARPTSLRRCSSKASSREPNAPRPRSRTRFRRWSARR